MDIAEDEASAGARGTTLAAMRTLERLGSMVGLLAAALIVAATDLLVAMGVVGLAVVLAGLAFMAWAGIHDRRLAHA
jgi:hypothetical protein